MGELKKLYNLLKNKINNYIEIVDDIEYYNSFNKGIIIYFPNGECYQILVNSASEGTITHTVKGTPTVNTYEVGKDLSGTYQAIVYITTISK